MKILVVIDMQNDFISGALGTAEAQAIVPAVAEKIRNFQGDVRLTMDTHGEDYLQTQEGKLLPVPHCIRDTWGWQRPDEIESALAACPGGTAVVYPKETFGSTALAEELRSINGRTPIEEITLIGLCTDICVISNALMIRAFLPEVPITVDAACCAGVSPERHHAALDVMRSCLIRVIRDTSTG